MALNKLHMEIGMALAEGRMHPAVSRELMIWLGCHNFVDLQVLTQSLQAALLQFCELQHLAKEQEIAGRYPDLHIRANPSPWRWITNASDRAPALCSYYTASEQDILAAGLFKKIAEMRELTNH